jgi:hypothetical protein
LSLVVVEEQEFQAVDHDLLDPSLFARNPFQQIHGDRSWYMVHQVPHIRQKLL